ncbi:kinase-like domain-containing protein [Baffinella frigidus]|nr:kinase-like domain-containing protein [Cryptophyta sp. CCMP2293]
MPPPEHAPYSKDAPVPGSAKSSDFDLGSRYLLRGKVGSGAFSSVVSGKDTLHNELVAVKRVGNACPDVTALRRLQRELSLLRRVRGHSNLVSVSNLVVRSSTTEDAGDVTDCYLVTDLMCTDLAKMLDSDLQLSLDHIRCLMFQFLRALRHLDRCRVVHRDIKPGNLLIDELWHLKICDLGIARSSGGFDTTKPIETFDARFTDYVVTRPYRAPELLMGSKNYTSSVDVWAAGCIFAELIAAQRPKDSAPLVRDTQGGLVRLPLFPGLDHRDMVHKIVGVLGHPSEEVLTTLTQWEPRARAFVEKQPYRSCDLESKEEWTGVEGSSAFCSVESVSTNRVPPPPHAHLPPIERAFPSAEL